ncbi:type II secretion system F family protein [Amycolatopsis sp. cmx-4-68]|uniref:type II secretion system F family protein n=1 Tax=Amycolatopsis sp. cmx-4-68 TaxID=2790938 RepID=UPI00397826E6
MIVGLLVGTGIGAGAWLLVAWAVPLRPALGSRLARSTRPAGTASEDPTGGSWLTAWGQPIVSVLRAAGLPGAKLRADLRIAGSGIDAHLLAKVLLTVAGLLAPWLMQLVLSLGGLAVAVEISMLAALVLAPIGFVLPDLLARARGTRLRQEFRAALSAFLDLVSISLAGGSGVESALGDAAAIGRGPAFEQIRRALQTAQLNRTTPWSALHRLGDDLDISALTELAASLSLAGTEGARIRASLSAKAQTLRTHQMTDAEAEAHSATERMALPVSMLFLGFLTFIAYPALLQVLNGL